MRLRRVRPGVDAGFRRARSGRGFRYTRADGSSVPEESRRRARALSIPPAWTDVWISDAPEGHIQAVGTDEAGRRQYRYHADWSGPRDRNKFDRALDLAEAAPRMRARVTRDLARPEVDRLFVEAVALRLLDRLAIRLGHPRYARTSGARGLITLQRRDVRCDGDLVALSFPAKSGKRARLQVHDAALATALQRLQAGSGTSLLLTVPQSNAPDLALTPAAVAAAIERCAGVRATAKDFRTLRGTIVAASALATSPRDGSRAARTRAERAAVRAAADALTNTPAVARSSYIDPRVFRLYRRGVTLDARSSPTTALVRLMRPSRPPATTPNQSVSQSVLDGRRRRPRTPSGLD